jgi:tetratricopeptide (TPR) repeat protein
LCRVNLAALLRQDGRIAEAAEEASTALEILDDRFESTHPWKLAASINLGNILLCQGRYIEAHGLFRTAWSTAEEVLPVEHPYLKLLRRSMTNVDAWQACGERGEPLVGLTDVDVEIPTT